jgi:hypothetical protein
MLSEALLEGHPPGAAPGRGPAEQAASARLLSHESRDRAQPRIDRRRPLG